MSEKKILYALIALVLIVPYIVILLLANAQDDLSKAIDLHYVAIYYGVIYSAGIMMIAFICCVYSLFIKPLKNRK